MKTSPRILVFAYSDVGHACLKLLLDHGENVVGVYTHEDQPGEALWFPSVRQLAMDYSIPVSTQENLRQDFARIQQLSAELIFSFYYRKLIPMSVVGLPRLGAYNMHGSYLPKYRGRAPVNWAVLNGETRTGATLHFMVEEPDAGDIVDQEAVPIGPDDTSALVQSEVTKAAVRVLLRQIENLKTGTAPRKPQDHTKASYFGRRKAEDGQINWSWPAVRIHNLVRAVTHPYPGAFGDLNGEPVVIWKTRLSVPHPACDGLFVRCGDENNIEIMSLQKKGEQEMTGKKFMERQLSAGLPTPIRQQAPQTGRTKQ